MSDIWDDDAEVEHADLNREWQARESEYYNVGYREGLDKGKYETVQQGFDEGYAAGSAAGYHWGVFRGAAFTARELASAPEAEATQTYDALVKLQPGLIGRALFVDDDAKAFKPNKSDLEQIAQQGQAALEKSLDVTLHTKHNFTESSDNAAALQ